MTTTPEREALAAQSYDMIDQYLRNMLGDSDCAEFSAALDRLAASPAAVAQPLTDEQIDSCICYYDSTPCDPCPELDIHSTVRKAIALAATPPAAPAQAKPQGALTRDNASPVECVVAGWNAAVAAEPVPAPVQRVAWCEHVEQRIRGWRQSTMNRSGDRLAIDDFMGQDSIDDLVDFVCDQWAEPAAATPPVESVERDAARYRWLRDVGDATWRPFGIRKGYSAAQADAAIDAALAQQGDKEQQP